MAFVLLCARMKMAVFMLEFQATEKRDARQTASWNALLIFVAVGLRDGKIMICKMNEIFMRYETRRLFI